jgi:hypothetical protein
MNIYRVLLNIAFVSYYYYTCELNIMGTRVESSVPFSQTGCDSFWGKTTWGSTGFLPGAKLGGERLQDGSRWRLPSSEHRRQWAVAPALFRLQEVDQHLPHSLLLLLSWFNGSNQRRLARIWWRLGFGGFQALRAKILSMGCAIYMGFLIES